MQSYITTICQCLGYILIATQISATVSARRIDYIFTSEHYTGTIPECSISCEKIYVTAPVRMGIQLPHSHKIKNKDVKFKVTKPNRGQLDGSSQFKAESLVVGDFVFLFIRTRTDGASDLNREGTSFYSLNIRATIVVDGGQTVNIYTQVDITILDTNDALPLFAQKSYRMNVAESSGMFTTVGSVRATDADQGFNAEIYYSFEDWITEFAIHPTSGEIYLTRNLTVSCKLPPYLP